MVANPFNPQKLVGRQEELERVCQLLNSDGDLLIAGVPGSGRRTLIRSAAQQIGAKVIEIDCLRATDANRLLEILAEGIIAAFNHPSELVLIQRWSNNHPVILEQPSNSRTRLVWHIARDEAWKLLQVLLSLPQQLAEMLNCRVVVMFQNLPHIRSWDRSNKWEHHICQEIQWQSRVSYTLIATAAETLVAKNDLPVVTLPPLKDVDVQEWITSVMSTEGFKFEAEALVLFLSYVQGHFGDAIALARRVWLDLLAFEKNCHSPATPFSIIEPHHVHRSALALVEDLAFTFESLILLLPPSQVRVLESLALDPTDSPHAREYIRKHQLSRGGGLQGALASLEQKGLVYGPEQKYRLTMPLLALWLKHRLA
jgi:hypothetical protein